MAGHENEERPRPKQNLKIRAGKLQRSLIREGGKISEIATSANPAPVFSAAQGIQRPSATATVFSAQRARPSHATAATSDWKAGALS